MSEPPDYTLLEAAHRAAELGPPSLDASGVRLYLGDCIAVMRNLPAESIDAIITDPPYGLGFMGKQWDSLPPGVEWAAECLRVLKPGGHLAAFGGTRTAHRMTCAIEDAGFEIRDTLAWLYGSGFPKSLDVSKAIDKAAGATREVVGMGAAACEYLARGEACPGHGDANGRYGETIHAPETRAGSPDAERWQGWGTALKPAHEPITLARKPLRGTVAANVLEHGTGALHIDACRIETDASLGRFNHAKPAAHRVPDSHPGAKNLGRMQSEDALIDNSRGLGRWPANVILDAESAAILDQQTGEWRTNPPGKGSATRPSGFAMGALPEVGYHGDRGGASRFFYTAKASKRERGEGNNHPTVKPLALMRWLVRLATPPGGLILDPFLGSGTTALAALSLSHPIIGIEQDAAYLDIAKRRLSTYQPQLDLDL